MQGEGKWQKQFSSFVVAQAGNLLLVAYEFVM